MMCNAVFLYEGLLPYALWVSNGIEVLLARYGCQVFGLFFSFGVVLLFLLYITLCYDAFGINVCLVFYAIDRLSTYLERARPMFLLC